MAFMPSANPANPLVDAIKKHFGAQDVRSKIFSALTGQTPPPPQIAQVAPRNQPVAPSGVSSNPTSDEAGGILLGDLQRKSQDAQTAYQTALQAQSKFDPSFGPDPQYNAPTEQPANKGMEIGALLAAAFNPRSAPFAGQMLKGDEARRAAELTQATAAAQAKFDADSQNAQRIERHNEFEERQLQNRVGAAQKQVEFYDREQVTALKNYQAHQVGQQRADAYASRILTQNKNDTKRIDDMAAYHAAQIGLGNKRIATTLEVAKWNIAERLQSAGMRSSTSLMLADRREQLQLMLERLKERAADVRDTKRDEVRTGIAALGMALKEYDGTIRAASIPGAPPEVQQRAQDLLSGKDPGYQKALAAVTGLVNVPQMSTTSDIQQQQMQAQQDFLSQADNPMLGAGYPAYPAYGDVQGGAQPLQVNVNLGGINAGAGGMMGYGGGGTGVDPVNGGYGGTSLTPTFPKYAGIIKGASRRFGVPAPIINQIISQESAGNPTAESSTGAHGLMQLMPKTAAGLGVTNAYDPGQNINGGTRYLRSMYDRYHDWGLAAAAYNAGPGAVDSWLSGKGSLPQETVDYINKFRHGLGATQEPVPESLSSNTPDNAGQTAANHAHQPSKDELAPFMSLIPKGQALTAADKTELTALLKAKGPDAVKAALQAEFHNQHQHASQAQTSATDEQFWQMREQLLEKSEPHDQAVAQVKHERQQSEHPPDQHAALQSQAQQVAQRIASAYAGASPMERRNRIIAALTQIGVSQADAVKMAEPFVTVARQGRVPYAL